MAATAGFEKNFQGYVSYLKQYVHDIHIESTVKKLVDFVIAGANTVSKFHNVVTINLSAETLDELAKMINSFECTSGKCPPSTFSSCINKIPHKGLQATCEGICTSSLKDEVITETIKEAMTNELLKAKEKMICKMIEHGAYVSLTIFVIQGLNLYFSWKEISRATNVLEESAKKFPEIQEKMENLQKESIKLIEMMMQYELVDNAHNKIRLAIEVSHLTNSMNCEYMEAKELISELKVKINGKIERIDLSANRCIADGVSNTLQAVINFFQFWQLGDMASGPHKIIQGTVTGVFAVLAVSDAIMYTLSKQTLKKLRDAMEEIEKFEKQFKIIRDSVRKAEKWYIEKRDEEEKIFLSHLD